jgi:hypothetical protein
MEGDESGRQSSFKVQDRRRFSATGEAREDAPDERAEAPSPGGESTAASQPHEAHTAPPDDPHAPHDAAPAEITFASFVFSLSTQALVHLGEVPDPIDGTARIDLEGARQIIDILAILAEKTRGNLDAAESSLLESALYDLRMRFVDRARRA